jgi:predicted AAA+ superfamily ATPase
MPFIHRAIEPTVLEAGRGSPAVVITGPRRTGKTTMLRRLFPSALQVRLEDPAVQARARSDPRTLLDELPLPVLFDEIQNVPELFDYIRSRIDRNPREMGQWLFTGSQESPLMQGVSESMTGRAAVLQL